MVRFTQQLVLQDRQIWAGTENILAVIQYLYEGGIVKRDQMRDSDSVYDLGPFGALAQMHDLQLINFYSNIFLQ